jgi:hypothetical protein
MHRVFALAVVAAVCAVIAAPAGAGTIGASAVVTAAADGPNFDYTITLTNTSGAGNDSIGTFWFAWVPGADFMATSPISVTNPTGWKDTITHAPNTPTNGYAIEWVELNAGAAIAPGNSLVFRFTSADTPAELAGLSVFYPTTPVLTSVLYQGTPFQGDTRTFVPSFAAAVPEPSSLCLGLVAIAGSLAWRRLRRRAKG